MDIDQIHENAEGALIQMAEMVRDAAQQAYSEARNLKIRGLLIGTMAQLEVVDHLGELTNT